jgi:hypothetical protein
MTHSTIASVKQGVLLCDELCWLVQAGEKPLTLTIQLSIPINHSRHYFSSLVGKREFPLLQLIKVTSTKQKVMSRFKWEKDIFSKSLSLLGFFFYYCAGWW